MTRRLSVFALMSTHRGLITHPRVEPYRADRQVSLRPAIDCYLPNDRLEHLHTQAGIALLECAAQASRRTVTRAPRAFGAPTRDA
jgi:hypothetical protein